MWVINWEHRGGLSELASLGIVEVSLSAEPLKKLRYAIGFLYQYL